MAKSPKELPLTKFIVNAQHHILGGPKYEDYKKIGEDRKAKADARARGNIKPKSKCEAGMCGTKSLKGTIYKDKK